VSNIKYSIICCYYNELNILEKKFQAFIKEVENLPFSYEVFVCDNNSDDGTREFLQKIESQKIEKFNFVYNSKNLGKGGSIKKCIKHSKGEFILIFDIDEYLTKDLIISDNLIVDDEGIDFLAGSRTLNQKEFIYKKNYYGVMAITMLMNFLFKINISDSAGATKIFRKSIYDNLDVKTNGFDFEFDVLCKFAKKGHKIRDFPIEYFPRTYAEGKKLRAFRDGTLILRTILTNYLYK
tara:strand:+ start:334 stop:1044 length:711 start_codon:yes stop_codon:yes gene_type:complete